MGVGQVALRFLMNEYVVIPKSSKSVRKAENFDVVDFELTEDDREQIRGLDGGRSIILDPTTSRRSSGSWDHGRTAQDTPGAAA